MSSELSNGPLPTLTTQLLFARPTSAAVKVSIGERSHVMTVRCADGAFLALADAVDAALSVWLVDAFHGDGKALEAAKKQLVRLVKERHQKQLIQPRPADPRRLPLLLPKLPATGGTWRKARRPADACRDTTALR